MRSFGLGGIAKVSEDLNTISESGMYYASDNALKVPTGNVNRFGAVYHILTAEGAAQLYVTRSGRLIIRGAAGNVWASWQSAPSLIEQSTAIATHAALTNVHGLTGTSVAFGKDANAYTSFTAYGIAIGQEARGGSGSNSNGIGIGRYADGAGNNAIALGVRRNWERFELLL